jgi:hypothetical protein
MLDAELDLVVLGGVLGVYTVSISLALKNGLFFGSRVEVPVLGPFYNLLTASNL